MEYQVAVYCLAYNHEKYIEETLRGFVGQKTNFRYKVYVHDDASTDGTQEIIEKYARKYPDIIYPIFQKENQYTRGVKIFHQFILPLVESKYIACCEGDDYWCDENKLQNQYDYMESHRDCTLCVHNTKVIYADDLNKWYLLNPEEKDVDYNTTEVLLAGGSGLFHTSSFFYRRRDREEMPETLFFKGVGDFPLSLYLAQKGYVHYIGKVMSCYRRGVEGSWTLRNSATKQRQNNHRRRVIEWMLEFDRFTEYRYKEVIAQQIRIKEYDILRTSRRYKAILFDKRMREELYTRSRAEKIKVMVLFCCPWMNKAKGMLNRLRKRTK